MRKTVSLFITAIIFSSFFFSALIVKADSSLATLAPNPTITMTGGVGQIAITGTFNAAAGTAVTGALNGTHFDMLYGTTGGSGNPSINTLTVVTCWKNSAPGGSPANTCFYTLNSDDSGTINATLINLSAGNYVAIPYFENGGSQTTNGTSSGRNLSAIGDSQGINFTITGAGNNATYNLSNVTVTNNTGVALVTIGISATGTSPGASYLIEIGTATPPTSGSTYTCSETNPRTLSGPVTANALQANFNLTAPGTYCVQLRQLTSVTDTLGTPVASVSGGTSYFQNTVGAAVNGIFPVLGATVNANGTLNQTANSTGCSTSATGNTGYCLLAPLPGVGDTTGLLNVSTGIGSYINSIIKLVMGLIGVLAVLMIIVGAIEYMSTVNIGEKEGAKNRIVNALLGLVIALGSYLILNTINPNLTNLTVTVNTANVAGTPTSGSTTNSTTNTTPTNTTTTTGPIPAAICAAANAYRGTNTSSGPGSGTVACAWAVNNVLTNAGVANLDSTSVASLEAALTSGRGSLVSPSSAVCGDIAVQAQDGHVGICLNAGCSQVISNSSSNATFSWISDTTFAPSYTGGAGRIYQVNN